MSKIYSVQDQLDRLHQGSLDLNAYYTRLTTLWEELKNFEELPSCVCGKCTCGSNDRWIRLYERKNIVRFLMRLNDSFTQARRQIIMMDPLPEFTKIYNFVARDEQQRNLAPTASEPVVFQATVSQVKPRANYSNQGHASQDKPRPLCSYCGLLGHTIARCYKIHGYPPGYKTATPGYNGDKAKGKFSPRNGVHMVYTQSAEQVPQDQSLHHVVSYNGTHSAPVGSSYLAGNNGENNVNHSVNMINSGKSIVAGNSSNGGSEQISQLIAQLNRQLQGSAYQVIGAPPASGHTGSISAQGTTLVPSHYISVLEPSFKLPETVWILDTGASCHICCDLRMFSDIRTTQNTTISLPNNTTIPIHLSGTVHLSNRLTLHSVFYVPSFSFNLLSVSSLTKNKNLSVHFLS